MTRIAGVGMTRIAGAGVAGLAGAGVARVAVTGWSVHLPGLDEACAPAQANTLLGRKGLLMKEPATRLALLAVHRALKLGAGERVDGPVRTDTAVVASSNLGNVQTVVDVVRTVTDEGGKAVSPMVAPNASSNVLSGTVALWFKFGGPNLMVCSGRESGLHALRLGALLLRSGRATRVVVVGAEPDDPVATAIHAQGGTGLPLRSGAACVILEHSTTGLDLAAIQRSPIAADTWGDCYGAQGILAVALTAASLSVGALTGAAAGNDAQTSGALTASAPGDGALGDGALTAATLTPAALSDGVLSDGGPAADAPAGGSSVGERVA